MLTNYATRQKIRYLGLILVASVIIVGIATRGIYAYNAALNTYEKGVSELHDTEMLVAEIQYSFKLQVQEWKNILLRGEDPILFAKYYESFSNQFLTVQEKTAELSQFIGHNPTAIEVVDEFLYIHKSILSEYAEALLIYKNNGFNAGLADSHVRGIDRNPDQLLISLSSYLNTEIVQKRRDLDNELTRLEDQLIIAFICVQGLSCLILVRLTGNILKANLNDRVTGLGNRKCFVEAIKDLTKAKQPALIAILDINEFKIVNESCSNSGGDAYLRNIARLIEESLDDKDSVHRMGGDQFGIIIIKNNDDAQKVLKDINLFIESFNFSYADVNVSLSSSISSIYLCDKEGTDVEEILNKLYVGLQIGKTKGTRQITQYTKENGDIAWLQKQLRMVHKIPSILDTQSAVLFKQAITPINNAGLDTHYEILLRIKQEDGKYASPGLFLQAAERFHLITQVDRYVLTHVVEYLVKHPNDQHHYSINLSGQTLSDISFVDFVRQLFSSPLIPVERINFEITETEIIKNFSTAIQVISCLTDYRCKIFLDDFGTGMSSYAYIAKLGLDAIKIDGAFIQNIDKTEQNKAIVSSIVNLAKNMNIKTVAEFVETEEELATLKTLNVDYSQGYLLHKPELMYQPVIENTSKKIVDGAEVLLSNKA